MIVVQQLKLSIEESHNANDGNAKGCGEKHFVEHLFLLVSGLGLGHTVRFCSSCYKPCWGDNRPPRGAGSDPLHCSHSQRKSTSKPPGKGPGGKSIAAQSIPGNQPPKSAGQHRPPLSAQRELPKASPPLRTTSLLVHLYLQEDDAGNGGMGPR